MSLIDLGGLSPRYAVTVNGEELSAGDVHELIDARDALTNIGYMLRKMPGRQAYNLILDDLTVRLEPTDETCEAYKIQILFRKRAAGDFETEGLISDIGEVEVNEISDCVDRFSSDTNICLSVKPYAGPY